VEYSMVIINRQCNK